MTFLSLQHLQQLKSYLFFVSSPSHKETLLSPLSVCTHTNTHTHIHTHKHTHIHTHTNTNTHTHTNTHTQGCPSYLPVTSLGTLLSSFIHKRTFPSASYLSASHKETLPPPSTHKKGLSFHLSIPHSQGNSHFSPLLLYKERSFPFPAYPSVTFLPSFYTQKGAFLSSFYSPLTRKLSFLPSPIQKRSLPSFSLLIRQSRTFPSPFYTQKGVLLSPF